MRLMDWDMDSRVCCSDYESPHEVKAVFSPGLLDEVDDNRRLHVTITGEGVIIDAFVDDGSTLIGTMAMTADEWFERIAV